MEKMEKKKDIQPCNANNEWHGYHQWYHYNNLLMLRVMYKHDQEIGYEEYHDYKDINISNSNVNFYIR